MTKEAIEKSLQKVILKDYVIFYNKESIGFVDRQDKGNSHRIAHEEFVSMLHMMNSQGRVLLTIEYMREGKQELRAYEVVREVPVKPTRDVPEYHKTQLSEILKEGHKPIRIKLQSGIASTKWMDLSEDLLLDMLYEIYNKTYEEEV